MNDPHLFALMDEGQNRVTIKHFDVDANEAVVARVIIGMRGEPVIFVQPGYEIRTAAVDGGRA